MDDCTQEAMLQCMNVPSITGWRSNSYWPKHKHFTCQIWESPWNIGQVIQFQISPRSHQDKYFEQDLWWSLQKCDLYSVNKLTVDDGWMTGGDHNSWPWDLLRWAKKLTYLHLSQQIMYPSSWIKSQIQRVTLSSTCSSRDFSFVGGGFGGDGSWGCGTGDGGVGASDVTTTSSFTSKELLIFTGGGVCGGVGGGGAP